MSKNGACYFALFLYTCVYLFMRYIRQAGSTSFMSIFRAQRNKLKHFATNINIILLLFSHHFTYTLSRFS